MNLIAQTEKLDFPATLPTTVIKVSQQFDAPQVADIERATVAAIRHVADSIHPGQTVAIGVGSRGITNLAAIVRTAVAQLKAMGATPFITPAMGSHAGATAEGQRQMLAKLGIMPATVGVEIQATMEVKQIGQIPDGPPVYQDLVTAAADHTVLINRIKPHTSFRSTLESGLAKMAVVGLGKQQGAATMHSRGVSYLKKHLAAAARLYQAHSNLRGGIALLENGYHQTAEIVGLTAAEIGDAPEKALLERAKQLLPGLPFPEIDVLVVRELGKNISGTGLDTNVIGRLKIPRESENFGGPDIAVIVVLNLTPETNGNANGIGLANVTTTRVAGKIDWQATYTNTISAGVGGMWRASLPLTMPTDRQALSVAVRGCGQPQPAARWVFIHNTLTLDKLWVSPNLRPEVEAHPNLELLAEVPLQFNVGGAMTTPWELAD
jgi:hypothetical protein